MCQITVEEQLRILKEVREEVCKSRESALKFLQDAGLIKPPKKKKRRKKLKD